MINEKELKARMAGSLEAIKREIPALCESLGARKKDVDVATVSAFKTIEGIVDELAVKGGWIPCSEKLPEDGQTVLIQYEDRRNERKTMAVGWMENDYLCCWDDRITHAIDNAVAWMPLPEPYKEGNEE